MLIQRYGIWSDHLDGKVVADVFSGCAYMGEQALDQAKKRNISK
jgi:hypothetical protein